MSILEIPSIKIDINTSDIERQCREEAKARIDRYIKASFNDGEVYNSEGVYHQIIRQKIDEYCLSDEFKQKLDYIIKKSFDEAAASAITSLLNSKIRKDLFTATYEMLKKE